MNDLEYYSKSHLRIRTKKAQLIPMVLNEPQKIVHRKLAQQLKETGRIRAIILKARQQGISTYTASRFFRSVHLWPNQRCTVVAHEKDKSSELFEFYDRMYSNLIEEVKPPKISAQKGNTLHLVNDSKVVVDTAGDEDAGAGTTIQRLHASEMARWGVNAKETFISLAQTVPDEASEIIIESTAKGTGNFFHQMWDQAEAGKSGYIAIFLPWWIFDEYELELGPRDKLEIECSTDPYEREAQDVGFLWEGEHHKLTPEKLAWRRRVGIPEKCAGDIRQFQQEYPTTPEEAFLASGDTFFDKPSLLRYKRSVKDPVQRGILRRAKSGTIVFVDDPAGPLRIWEKPRPEGRYVVGADTASGRRISATGEEHGGRDFSCADVLDVHTRQQVAQIHTGLPPESFAEQLYFLGNFYNTAVLAPEKNHTSGETVIKKLSREYNYPAMYYARQMNTRMNRMTPTLGWVTSKVTRRPMLDELSQALREDSIGINSADTVREMFQFVITEKEPQAEEGMHDDRVISLGIAWQLVINLHHEPPKGKLPAVEVYDAASGAFDYGWDQPTYQEAPYAD